MQEKSHRQIFDSEFIALLDSSSSSSRALFAFIKTNLRRFRLNGIYSVYDVLNEAYLRGVLAINSGQSITKPTPWIKTTCYNIIREISRKQDKYYPLLDADQVSEDDNQFSVIIKTLSDQTRIETPEAFDEVVLEALLPSLLRLEPKELRILQLRVMEDLSWEEVRQRLMIDGETISISSLRQQGYRALKHLRKLIVRLE